MQGVEQLGSDTDDVAKTIRWIVQRNDARSPRRRGRLPYPLIGGLWLAIAWIAFFGSGHLANHQTVRTERNVRHQSTTSAARPETTVVQSYYIAAKPSSGVPREKRKPLTLDLPVSDPTPDIASEATPYRNGERARHLTGDALRQALIADRAITVQANVDARSSATSDRTRPPGMER